MQDKFASQIPYKSKKEVQMISLSEMKSYVSSDKNASTIASIFRSFIHSLNENYLDDASLEELFNYTKVVMIPLKKTYDASISALRLLSAQSSLFHPFIMKNALSLFKTLAGLMGETNKEYKFAVLDTLAVVVKQISIGISQDLENPKMVDLFNFIGVKTWEILDQRTRFDPNKT